MINIILCGGSGTRLWPISRTLMPKQFVKFFNKRSLYQLTLERNAEFCKSSFVVSNIDQYFLAKDQLHEISDHNSQENFFLLESIGRNTAPAITLAAMALPRDEILLITPSDHLIKNEVEYAKVLQEAKEEALKENLVTFGIKPTFAETGFGYIEAEGHEVKAFHEKPDLSTATKYLKEGNYYWNSGMFCFKAGVFLDELKLHSKEIYDACEKAMLNYKKDPELSNVIRIAEEDMLNIPSNSIDYAVMEKSKKVKVIPSDIEWSDLGSFDALYEELPKDQNGNTINENYVQIDSKNNLIYGNERKITTIDIEDLIIVDTGDALLISKKGSSQKVKNIVEQIKNDTELHNIHLTAHRPWGTYTILEDTPKYKIKRIEVKPSGRLSLQKHFHRSEHWTVVSGTAVVTLGEREIILRANESVYIPMGELHRLENRGKLDLVIIETQIGEYLGEDDIIRVEDDYKREKC